MESEEVKADPSAFERFVQKETFEVKIDPPRFYRHRIVRLKYRKVDDKAAVPAVAPTPLRAVEGLASNDLLAYVIVSNP